jgi:hypothetical protein
VLTGAVTSLTAGTGLTASPSPITGAGSFSIANTGLVSGSYQGITFNAQGQATTAINASYLTTNQTITLAGYASGSGMTSITVTNLKVQGVTDGSNAAAGDVGEFIQASITLGGAAPLTSGTLTVITSTPIAAGDWDVAAVVALSISGSPVITNVLAYVSPTSNGSPSVTLLPAIFGGSVTGVNAEAFAYPSGPARFTSASAQTAFLLTNVSFSGVGSGVSGYGSIRARRFR